MDVAAVGAKQRKTVQTPPQNGKRSVQNRQGQNKQWSGERGKYGAFLRAGNRQAADEETEKIRAAIAHVNARGREVEPQKPQQRTRHSGGNKGRGTHGAAHINQQDHQHQADATRKAVNTVNQIDQIGQCHKPEYRDQTGQKSEINDVGGEGNLKFMDSNAQKIGSSGDGHLADELASGTQRNKIIPQPKSEHGQRQSHDFPAKTGYHGAGLPAGQRFEEQNNQHEGHSQGHPAQT